jgi:type IV pilus assembly protein PilB
VNRLVNMGVEAFLVGNSLNLICAQRLVRRVCEGCKEQISVPRQRILDAHYVGPLEGDTVKIARGKGCDRCSGSGYKGRVGVFEVMEMTDTLRELVIDNAPAFEIKKKAIAEGMLPLRQSGLRKVLEGFTTLEEVVRETM